LPTTVQIGHICTANARLKPQHESCLTNVLSISHKRNSTFMVIRIYGQIIMYMGRKLFTYCEGKSCLYFS